MNEIDDFEFILRSDMPLIDTRSPTEFAKGSLPAAVNLPLMNNEEREAVGKCYKAQGQDAAIRLGHELVSGNLKEERVRAWQTFATRHPEARCFASVVVCDRRLRSSGSSMRGWIFPASKVAIRRCDAG